MLAVPCGLQCYVGPWPPVTAGAAMIAPLAELALSTPHAASASEDRAPEAAAEPDS
jgi:hypothetical protein